MNNPLKTRKAVPSAAQRKIDSLSDKQPEHYAFVVPETLDIARRAEIVGSFGDRLLENGHLLKPGTCFQLTVETQTE